MWLALNPFQVLLLIEVDPSRRIAMQQTGLNLVALSIGPAIGAFGVRDTDVRGAYWIAAAILVASGIMFMWARSHRRVLTM
jgi:MFS transporter, DHA1 family, inner membrane transport protein